MLLRMVRVNTKSVKLAGETVKVPTTFTTALIRPGDWHLHHHAESIAKKEGRVLDKGKRGDAPETTFRSDGIRFVHDQELSTSGKVRKEGAVMKALIKSTDTGIVYVIRDVRHARELNSSPGSTFNVLEWRME